MTAKAAYSIDELAEIAPLGRSKIYQAIREGELVARKAGRRTLVLRADYEQFLKSLPVSPKGAAMAS